MSDDELLEQAAKAAGIKYTTWHHKPAQVISYGNYLRETRFWDPLTDDGDALRLAVRLQMSLDTALGQSLAIPLDGKDCVEQHADDPLAAIRRAIVRAAAAMVEPPAAPGGEPVAIVCEPPQTLTITGGAIVRWATPQTTPLPPGTKLYAAAVGG